MIDVYDIHPTLAPPPSPEERLRKALNILDDLKAEYDIKCRGNHYSRSIIKLNQ